MSDKYLMEKYLYIGIDVSLNSTGITFISDNVQIRYLSILNKRLFTSSDKKEERDVIDESPLLSSLLKIDNLNVVMIDRKPLTDVKKIGLVDWSRKHVTNTLLYSDIIARNIEKIINDSYNDHIIHVGFENYSYGSMNSTATIQLIEMTAMIKLRLLDFDSSRINRYSIIPGPTIKMMAGKGNFDKFLMVQAYIGCPNANDHLHNFIKSHTELCWKKGSKTFSKKIKKNVKMGIPEKIIKGKEEIKVVLPPISDLVDSWWIADYMRRFSKIDKI